MYFIFYLYAFYLFRSTENQGSPHVCRNKEPQVLLVLLSKTRINCMIKSGVGALRIYINNTINFVSSCDFVYRTLISHWTLELTYQVL